MIFSLQSASKASVDDIEEAFEDATEDEPVVVDDNRPRTDIAPLITEALIAEINDKNWKVGFLEWCIEFFDRNM